MKTWIALPLLSLILFLGCEEQDLTSLPEPADTWYPMQVGGVSLEIQLSISSSEQRKGLMFRESLGSNHGMVFADRRDHQLSFWMANTTIPLSIGFFDSEGVLKEIHHMYPNDLNKTKSYSSQLRHALEVNRGWFKENGVGIGAQLDLDLLAEAIRKRGYDPADFGLVSN